MCEVDELLVLGNEVGLGVNLDHNAHAVLNGGSEQAGRCLTTFALGQRLQALQTNDFESLLGIAVGFLERLLDVHHACASLLAQSLHISSGEISHY